MSKILFPLLLLALLPSGAAWGLPPMEGVALVGCYDGDTCTFRFRGETMKIRVLGVDTPEIKGACPAERALARKARGYVLWHLKRAKRIDLLDVGPGKYYRYLARVMVDGKDLAQLVIAKKRGRPYHGGKREGWCA